MSCRVALPEVHHASKSEDLFVRHVHEPHWPDLSSVWPDLYLERWVTYVNMADIAEEDQVIAVCSSILVLELVPSSKSVKTKALNMG